MSTYSSKYPIIIIDKIPNSVNDSMQKKITVEEFYDLMHHTHDISSLVNSDGTNYDDMENSIKELTSTINELKNIIQSQQETIDNLTEDIEKLNNEITNMASVSDWDVETPGNQDINGNDLGNLMGFQMTEIAE